MSKPFHCAKCGLFLGEMDKGRIRNGAILLCDTCWGKAEIAIGMADLAAAGREAAKDRGDPTLDSLKDMFGMK